MTTSRYGKLTAGHNGVAEPNITNPMPPRNPAPAMPPKGADAAYLYSYEQDLAANSGRAGFPTFQTGADSPRLGFTEKMALNEDFQRRVAEWQKKYPDGRIMGYHTRSTQEFRANGAPTLQPSRTPKAAPTH
jgi:hypothetical protein